MQPSAPPETELRFPADTLAVRDGLAALMSSPSLARLDDEDRGTAELLLAEALNNVVEHAYARWSGEIAVRLALQAEGVDVVITDQGLPMPHATPPKGQLPELDDADLPEGGFGWFLIRSLAQDLNYRRVEETNELTFRIPINNWEA